MNPWIFCTFFTVAALVVDAAEIRVNQAQELKPALTALKSGDVLKIGPGTYPGGNWISNLSKLTIEAADPAHPPVFHAGTEAWHFTRCPDLTLRHLVITGQTGNGINLDDGGIRDQPVSGVTLEHLEVRDIGPTGNHDGIKISGLNKLTIRGCKLEGWGGQGIDMVGCHEVSVSECELRGKEGFSATAGIQMKGGCSEITVENCRLVRAGLRPLNVGGSTGIPFFRPPDAKYEARGIVVRSNRIEGSECAAAFVGLDGGEFSENTVLFPEKWVFRILQETREAGFAPCRNVSVRNNRIVFRRSQVTTEINIGDGSSPESFKFEANRWFAEDSPERSKPHLPVEEARQGIGKDPR